MAEDEWGPREETSHGNYVRYNSKTKRWYLYNKHGNLLTSNRKRDVLAAWRTNG